MKCDGNQFAECRACDAAPVAARVQQRRVAPFNGGYPRIAQRVCFRVLSSFMAMFAFAASTMIAWPISAASLDSWSHSTLVSVCLLHTDGESTSVTDQDQDAPSDEPSLAERQDRLNQAFRDLEQRLFDLYEFELDQNPDRSRLLRNAFELSKNRGIAGQLDEVSSELREDEYRAAIDGQRAALEELLALLEMLQNEDQSNRLDEEQDRIKSYIKEVERLLRIQQGIRGQTEGGIDPTRLADSQGQAADRAQRLADDIQQDGQAAQGTDDPSAPPDMPNEDDPQGDPSDDGSSDSDQGTPPDDGMPEDSEGNPDGNQDQDPDSDPNDPSDMGDDPMPGGESTPGNASPGEPGSPSDPSHQHSPVQDRVEAAQRKMREAQANLDQAKREDSVDKMREAEQELAKAKEELEEILRQLREEEVERTLAVLEARIREMLELELKIKASTEQLADIPEERRSGEFHIQAGKLSADQLNLALEADRLFLILQEEGSSIAFPEAVAQIRNDMEMVSVRLREAKIDALTLGFEQDIVDALGDLLNALIAAQEAQDNEQPEVDGPTGEPPPPGEQPLINDLEELKLVRNLQQQINKRHQRFSDSLADPDDPVGYTDDPDIQEALDQLGERQIKLQRITRAIVYGSSP